VAGSRQLPGDRRPGNSPKGQRRVLLCQGMLNPHVAFHIPSPLQPNRHVDHSIPGKRSVKNRASVSFPSVIYTFRALVFQSSPHALPVYFVLRESAGERCSNCCLTDMFNGRIDDGLLLEFSVVCMKLGAGQPMFSAEFGKSWDSGRITPNVRPGNRGRTRHRVIWKTARYLDKDIGNT